MTVLSEGVQSVHVTFETLKYNQGPISRAGVGESDLQLEACLEMNGLT
jgi:hypothetical protein